MKFGKAMIWVAAGGTLVLLGGYFSRKTISFSEICPRCLQRVSEVDRQVFGLTYSKTRRFVSTDRRLTENNASPFEAAHFLQQVLGQKCNHVFISQGKCVYTSAMVGCYGGQQEYFWRIQALEALCRLHQRLPDDSLSRRTYELVDHTQPIGTKTAAGDFYLLPEYLSLVTDTNDWEKVLALPQLTYTNAFFSEERLLRLLDQTNRSIRHTAFGQLERYNDERYWNSIGQLIGDLQLGLQAYERILKSRRFSLFGPMLRQMARESRQQTPDTFNYWPYSQGASMMQLLQELQEEEIQALLMQKDKFIDVFCFGAIAVQQKLQFADQMVAILNERYSKQAQVAIEELLAGPSPFNERDFHIWSSTRTVPILTNAWKWTANLSQSPRPESWKSLCTTFDKVTKSYSEWEAASIVLAMNACDASRTRSWLVEEIQRATNAKRRACLLAGMGAVADPAFLPVLEQLDESPLRPRKSDFPPEAACLDYALHRCRGIDSWRVEKDADGRFVLIKPKNTAGVFQ